MAKKHLRKDKANVIYRSDMKLNLRFAQGFYNALRYQLRKQKSKLSHPYTHTLTHKRFQNRRCIFSLVLNTILQLRIIWTQNLFGKKMHFSEIWTKSNRRKLKQAVGWLQCFTAINWTTTFRALKNNFRIEIVDFLELRTDS